MANDSENSKAEAAAERLLEQQLYERVAEEIASEVRVTGLWLKALADAAGDETAGKALYVKYRVQAIKDEIELSDYVARKEEEDRKENEKRAARQKAKAEKEQAEAEEIERGNNRHKEARRKDREFKERQLEEEKKRREREKKVERETAVRMKRMEAERQAAADLTRGRQGKKRASEDAKTAEGEAKRKDLKLNKPQTKTKKATEKVVRQADNSAEKDKQRTAQLGKASIQEVQVKTNNPTEKGDADRLVWVPIFIAGGAMLYLLFVAFGPLGVLLVSVGLLWPLLLNRHKF